MSGGRTVTGDGDVATLEREFLHIDRIKEVGDIGAVFGKGTASLIALDRNCNCDISYRNWSDSPKEMNPRLESYVEEFCASNDPRFKAMEITVKAAGVNH